MDAIIAGIKEIALRMKPALVQDDMLDVIVESVVNRAVIFMNRKQLKKSYEAAVTADAAHEPIYDWKGCLVTLDEIPSPIPEELWYVLGSTVIQAYKTAGALNDAETGFLQYISDNGQEQRYADKVMSFLTSSNDTDIFAGSTELLRQYILPTVIENTTGIQNANLSNLL